MAEALKYNRTTLNGAKAAKHLFAKSLHDLQKLLLNASSL